MPYSVRDERSRYSYAEAIKDPIPTYNAYGALSEGYDYGEYHDYDY